MKKLIMCVLMVLTIFMCSCSKPNSELAVENMLNITKHAAMLSEKEYDKYTSDLDSWATGDAYDQLVTLPDSLREISNEDNESNSNYSPEINVEIFNIYASFTDVDLEEFSDFYLFDSEDFLINNAEGDNPSLDTGKNYSSAWNDELTKRFNPKKNHNVDDAKCFIGYGYYTFKFGTVEYRYYLAVKCNSEGKVEKFINNYLGTN